MTGWSGPSPRRAGATSGGTALGGRPCRAPQALGPHPRPSAERPGGGERWRHGRGAGSGTTSGGSSRARGAGP
eukprot:8136466-Pyramimonas_sp.AAC.1